MPRTSHTALFYDPSNNERQYSDLARMERRRHCSLLSHYVVTLTGMSKKNQEIIIRYYDQDHKIPNKFHRCIQQLLGHYVCVILDNVHYEFLDYLVIRKSKIFQNQDVNIGSKHGAAKSMSV